MKKHLIGFILLVAGLSVVKVLLPDNEPITDVEQAKIILEKNGYHCVREEKSGTIVVSTEPIPSDPDFGFQWQYTTGWDKGKVLVFSHRVLNYPSTRTVSWGAVSATGDETLLTKIDELFR